MHSQSSLNLRDPRSKASSSHSAKMANELFAFLKQIGHEKPRQIQLNSVKNIGMVMTDLFRQLDPNYTFDRRVEDEFVRLLRALQYPYQITKNDMYQLQNNQSSGLILSALHWLMELVKYATGFNPEEFTVDRVEDHENKYNKLKWELLYCLVQTKDDSEKQVDIVNNFNEQLREQELEGVDTQNMKSVEHALEKLASEEKELIEKSSNITNQIDRITKDITTVEGNILKTDEFLQEMQTYTEGVVNEVKELDAALGEGTENLKLLMEDIQNAKEIVRSQPFTVEECAAMKDKMAQIKIKIGEYQVQHQRMNKKHDEIECEINTIRNSLKRSCEEIREKCNHIRNYPYLKTFLNENTTPITSLDQTVSETHLTDTSQLVTEDSIVNFLNENNLKENLKSCENIVLTLCQKIEKENEALGQTIKTKNNQVDQMEGEIDKYNRELAHIELQCQNMEKKSRSTNNGLTEINDRIFNLKRSKLSLDQDIFQLQATLDDHQEKLRMETLKNDELIEQLKLKYQKTFDECLKVSLLELERIKSTEKYLRAKVVDVKHFCEIDARDQNL